jgi:hypothetical protein
MVPFLDTGMGKTDTDSAVQMQHQKDLNQKAPYQVEAASFLVALLHGEAFHLLVAVVQNSNRIRYEHQDNFS